jgi:hypothetical protein
LLTFACFAAGGSAWAAECSNPCWLDPNQLCVGTTNRSGYVALVEAGAPVRLAVERHPGRCGGLVPVGAERLRATLAEKPAGPFVPVATTHDQEQLLFTPPRAGDLYLRVAEEGALGEGLALVRVVAPPLASARIRLTGIPPAARKGWVDIRALPDALDAALDAGFNERSWPWVYSGNELLDAPVALKLGAGGYQVRWEGPSVIALQPFRLAGESELVVSLPRSSVRIQGSAPREGWLLLALDADGQVAETTIHIDSEWKKVDLRVYLPSGSIRVRWYQGDGACPFRRPAIAPISDEKLNLKAGATLKVKVPPATSRANRR